jgi:prepilin-type N-terminal cleavage/methylation domain-containing protein
MKKAFTLAEVLVTLGIIGVVSALTIPNLMQNWQRKTYVTQLHSIYNTVQRAFTDQMTDTQAHNIAEAGFYRDGSPYNIERNFLNKNFKIVKDCGTSTSGCFASTYRNINGGSYTLSTSGRIVTLANGAAVSFYIDGLDTGDENSDDYVGYMYVDTNGQSGPNILGRDLFVMYFFSDGVLDAHHVNPNCRKNGTNCGSGSSATERRNSLFATNCKSATSGSDSGGCFGKLLNDNWQMNY